MKELKTITELEILKLARRRLEEDYDRTERKIDEYATAGCLDSTHLELCEKSKKIWEQIEEIHEVIVKMEEQR